MLFIATSEKYYLDSVEYKNLKLPHILVPVEGSLNSYSVIGVKIKN